MARCLLVDDGERSGVNGVLGRLVHGAACFGAPPDELARLASGRADVVRAALVFDQLEGPEDGWDESPVPRVDVLRVLRATLAMLEG